MDVLSGHMSVGIAAALEIKDPLINKESYIITIRKKEIRRHIRTPKDKLLNFPANLYLEISFLGAPSVRPRSHAERSALRRD